MHHDGLAHFRVASPARGALILAETTESANFNPVTVNLRCVDGARNLRDHHFRIFLDRQWKALGKQANEIGTIHADILHELAF